MFDDNLYSDDVAWACRLLKEFDDICYAHDVGMNSPLIRISDSKTDFGSWEPGSRTLCISRHLIESYPWQSVLEVFKHEMAHQYVSEVMNKKDAHGSIFKEACKILGVHPDFIRAGGEITPQMLNSENRLSSKANKMIKTVQKLLSLAESDNVNEAKSASRKANALIRKHNLDLFNDDSNFGDSKAESIVLTHKKKQITRLQKGVLNIVNEFYYVDSVLTKYYDAKDNDSYQSMVLFGLPENLKIAEYVYFYLVETGNRLWQENRSAHGYTRGDQVSFYIGFTQGINKTLAASKLPIKSGPLRSDSRDLKAVISAFDTLSLSMNAKIATEMNRVFPKTFRPIVRYHHSDSAFKQGYEEGKNTHIKKGIHNKDTNSPLFITSKQ